MFHHTLYRNTRYLDGPATANTVYSSVTALVGIGGRVHFKVADKMHRFRNILLEMTSHKVLAIKPLYILFPLFLLHGCQIASVVIVTVWVNWLATSH